jgi:hypothetical protein
LPGLGFARRHGDEAAIQINLAPVEPLQFGRPKAREGTEGQVRPQGRIGFLEQAGDVFRREDRNSRFRFLVPHHAGKRTAALEQMALLFRPIAAGPTPAACRSWSWLRA